MAPRKLFPMPVQELFEHPAYVALPAAGRGMLLSALETFWRSDCRALPTNDDGLFATVKAHRSTWRKHKPEIMQVFHDVAPALVAYWRERSNKQEQLRIAARNGAAIVKASRALAAVREQAPPAPVHVAPIREPTQAPRPPKPADRPARARLTDAA